MAFACLFVPDFPVQAVVRLELELQRKAVAIFAGAPPLTKVFAMNQEARDRGVATGMTKVQAEGFSGIAWRWRSVSQEATAYAALLDCAWTISPRIEQGPKREGQDFSDTVVLDLAGCETLFGSSEKIADDLRRVAGAVGFTANVAVAGNPSAAVTVAQGFAGTTVIPAGEEAVKIGSLSLEALHIPFEFVETLHRWGIHTCAEFARLSEIAIAERLGQAGLHWWWLAQGRDVHPLMTKDAPAIFEERMDLECSVDLLEPLLFILNRLLEQLCVRVRMHVLAIGEIKVALTLEPNNSRHKKALVHIRTIRLPVPTRDNKLLLKLLQLDLEAHPPSSSVIAVSMVAVPVKAHSQQFGLFLPLSPDPECLEITLARIQGMVGENRVGAPMLLDTHGPNGFQQMRFVLTEMKEKRKTIKERQPTVVMRIYRPPLPATVEFREGKPTVLGCEGARRQILAFAGPWRRKGDWWSETTWSREEWDMEIGTLNPKVQLEQSRHDEGTALYHVYKDLCRNRWFVEGIYD